MEEQKSFTQRVKETVIHSAYLYKKYYVEYEYLLCSKAFEKSEYYIISAHEDNYLHLTGLHTDLDALSFLRSVIVALYKKVILIFAKMDRMKKKLRVL